MKETRISEQASLYNHLEDMQVAEIIRHINHENIGVPQAVGKALPAIAQLITAIEEKLGHGGRLFYVGCGTGGRLAILDTIEVQNTYGNPPQQIQAIFPGGVGNITHPEEASEDNIDNGWQQLQALQCSRHDIVVGLSVSGTTPFVLATLGHCRDAGIATGCIVGNPGSPIAAVADYCVEVITGPEFVTGSTRMKGGTAQKLILDMISTTVQIRLGRVEGNRMVNAKLLNHKLIDRAVRTFMLRNPQYTDYSEVEKLIMASGSVKKAEQQATQLRTSMPDGI